MHSNHARNTSVVCLALALVAALAAGCSGRPEPEEPGVARVVVRPLTDGSEVARVTVTVSKGDGSDFTPIVAELTRSGVQFIGRIASIPPGPRRQFDVVAYDAAGVVLYTGTGWADIVSRVAAVVSIYLSGPRPPPIGNAFPIIDSLSWSREQVAPRGTVQLIVTAHDPNPGDTLTYSWTADCGSFDDPTLTAPRWTAPGTDQICHLGIHVTDNHLAETQRFFSIQVTSSVGDADVVVILNSWPVIDSLAGTVTLGPTMQGDLVANAFDPDGDALAYAWTSTCLGIVLDTQAPYTTVAPHFSLPQPADPCSVTVTVSDGKAPGGTQASVVLPAGTIGQLCQNVDCPIGQLCDPADGQCKPVGPCVPACTGRVCGPDGCGGVCGTCTSGTCSVSGQCVVSCTPSCPVNTCGPDGCGGQCTCTTGTCNTTTNQCVVACAPSCPANTCGPDGCGGQCTCTTGTCDTATNQCVVACTPTCPANTCGPDGCGGQCACTTGTCDTATNQCVVTPPPLGVVTPQVARDLQLSPPAGIAMDAAGNTYVAGNLFTNVDVDFQTRFGGPPLNLRSFGGVDAFVAKYDAAGDITWAVTVADDDPVSFTFDQTATNAAVTQNGTVAAVGKVVGTVTFGTSTIAAAAQLPYIGAFASADGARKWGKGFNLGSNGAFRAIATSASSTANRIAVCGTTNIAANLLVAPNTTTFGGLTDLVVAVFDSAGNKLWATQLGGTGNENCNAVAVDDAGDVYAAGQFDSASLTFPGAPALTGPGTTARKFMWVAKFAGAGNGSGGASTLRAVAYSGTGGTVNANALAVGPSGELVVGGQFAGNLTLGAAMTSNGGDDAFVAKLDGATLAPVWNALQFGGTALDLVRSVSVTSLGDILVTGTFNPSTAAFRTANGGFDTVGALPLVAHGTTASDMLVGHFDATGGTIDGRAYGDAATQNGDGVVANRFGADQVSIVGTGSGTIDFGGAAGAVTAAGGTDALLVFAAIQ
jgi:hypothetical protein